MKCQCSTCQPSTARKTFEAWRRATKEAFGDSVADWPEEMRAEWKRRFVRAPLSAIRA
jgi:hypothetical protein